VEKYGRIRHGTDDNTAHALCMLDNSGYKHSENIIFVAFPQQQWFRERTLVSRYTCIICFVQIKFRHLLSASGELRINSSVFPKFPETINPSSGMDSRNSSHETPIY
jgi:hypothetical protein